MYRRGETQLTARKIVARIAAWQAAQFVPALTCNVERSHRPLVPQIEEREVILHCPDCGYRQTTIPETVLTADLAAIRRTLDALRARGGIAGGS
jgi:hypothetical protein